MLFFSIFFFFTSPLFKPGSERITTAKEKVRRKIEKGRKIDGEKRADM